MIKIDLKESILNLIHYIEEREYEAIVKAINNPEFHDPSFYDDVSFEDIVIFKKELIDFDIMHKNSEFIDSRNNLIKLMNKLIINRLELTLALREISE